MKNSEKVMIVPVGEQIEPLLYGLRFFKEIDTLILLHSRKTKKIANKIKKRVEKTYLVSRVVMAECVPNSLVSVIASLNKTLNNLDKVENQEVVINLTGGTKIMSIACYIFSILVGAKCFYIFKKDDGKMEFQDVPVLENKSLQKIKESKIRISILKSFDNDNKLSVTELSKMIRKHPSTILYYLDELVKSGILIKEKRKYRITELGLLIKRIVNYNI